MMRITRVKLRQRITRLETSSSTRKRLSNERLVWNKKKKLGLSLVNICSNLSLCLSHI